MSGHPLYVLCPPNLPGVCLADVGRGTSLVVWSSKASYHLNVTFGFKHLRMLSLASRRSLRSGPSIVRTSYITAKYRPLALTPTARSRLQGEMADMQKVHTDKAFPGISSSRFVELRSICEPS